MLWPGTFSKVIRSSGNANFQDVKDQGLTFYTTDSARISPTIMTLEVQLIALNSQMLRREAMRVISATEGL
jgi:hypothetical protein